jgi:hypothetical protein
MRTLLRGVIVATTLLPLAATAANVMLTEVTGITVNGVIGQLRADSIWAGAPPPAAASTLHDGVFLPTGTVWTNGTVWWDELAFPTAANPVSIEFQLSGLFALERFVVQGDDNEAYHVDWWDGVAWQPAYIANAVFSFGMETRDSGLLAPITTDRLRVRASGGDGYYSLAEVQAFTADQSVPEPGTLALAGAAIAVALSRRRYRM